MDQLISLINRLQNVINKHNITGIELPQIVVVGSQSSGKSSVMERIIAHDILPKAAKVATRCPIVLQLLNSHDSGDIMGIFSNDVTQYHGAKEISEQLRERNNSKDTLDEGVTDKPIILQLYSNTLPTLTLIDLPGIIKNDGELPAGCKDKIITLNQCYASQKNSIILAISAANVDLSNSDSIAISKEYDPEGKRTLNVITKIDIMDKGTSVTDILSHVLLTKSLGTVCVVNRNQDSVTKKKSIKDTNGEEIEYFASRSKEITGKHGADELIRILVYRLDEEIRKNIPEIDDVIKKKIQSLTLELEKEETGDKREKLHRIITKFINKYKSIVKGKIKNYDELVGGAKISVAIYTKFEKEVDSCEISKKSNDQMAILIKNTTGTKNLSLSFEKPFHKRIKEEIDKFQSPSLECNDDVRFLLKSFVGEIIKELHLDKYSILPSQIEDDMEKFITKKHRYTEEIIKNIIRCEKKDLYSIRPEQKQDGVGNFAGAVIDLAVKTVGYNLPGPLRMILSGAIGTDLLPDLKNWVTGILQTKNSVPKNTPRKFPQKPKSDQQNSEKSSEDKFKEQVTIPSTLASLMSTAGIGVEGTTDIIDLINNGEGFADIIGSIMDQFGKVPLDKATEADIMIIEQMVETHFKIIQNHMKCNVSKWIQTVFIKDLLDGMDDALLPIRQGDAEQLLSINPEEDRKIKEKIEQLEELKGIAADLLKIRRSGGIPNNIIESI